MIYRVEITTYTLPDMLDYETESVEVEHAFSFFTAKEWFENYAGEIPEGLTAEINVEFYHDGDSPNYGDEPIRTSSCTVTPDGTVHTDDAPTDQETEADALATSDAVLVAFGIEHAVNDMIADLACRPHLAQITAYKNLAEKLSSAASAAYTLYMAIGRKHEADHLARLHDDLIKAADI